MTRLISTVFAAALTWGTLSAASAQEASWSGKTLGSISVSGNKRIEKEAVLSKIALKPGQELSEVSVRADVQSLFNMGYFEEIEVRGDVAGGKVALTFVVKERPLIASIDFEGNEQLSTSDLREVIKLKDYAILDINKVKEDVALLQKHYEEKGFYLAKVSYEIRSAPSGKEGEVELVYRINDYEKVSIKKITFLNNKHFTDDQLKGIFRETKEGNAISFVTGSGSFKESAFKQDLQMLTYWYLEHGYVKFKYENPVVTVSDDKRWLYVTVYVDEGDKYEMGELGFGGDLLFSKEELDGDVSLRPGDTFAISKRNADIQKLSERYQDLGYAFVNVIPKMSFRDDQKKVDIEYNFEKGNLVYFGEINVAGNSKTWDKVIRRELRIQEGALYSGSKLRISKENVERLGYFAPGEVVFNTLTPKGKLDVLDVEITVKERSTGTITLGAGFGSVQGFFLTGQVAEINFLGMGQTISFSVQYSAQTIAQNFNLGFTEPYLFDTRWTVGGDLFYVAFPIPFRYTTRKTGGALRVGHPLPFIDDYTQFMVTYKIENLLLLSSQSVPQNEIDADSGLLSSLQWSIIRDRRNNRFETTGGNYQSAIIETAGLGGNKSFVKGVLNNRFYTRLFGDLVFRNSTEAGAITQIGNAPIPPSEKFYLGGANNMKGYAAFFLGPTRQVIVDGKNVTQPYGGTFEFFSLFELEHPLIREAGIKFVTFFDIGHSWENIYSIGAQGIKMDAGFGIRWFSPIGPLRFEWGYPLNPGPLDGPQFVFFIGPPF